MANDMGRNIRRIRRQQNRTLAEIAGICGFTRSLLSKIENGKTMPPISTLTKIAGALGVNVSDLLESGHSSGTVYTKKEQLQPNNLVQTDKGYSFHAFAVQNSSKAMQPYFFHARKGEIKTHLFSHQGEEFVYMLTGSMKYRVGDIEYTLHEGDSIYFDANEEHMLTPLSDEVTYMAVFAEVSRRESEENLSPKGRSR